MIRLFLAGAPGVRRGGLAGLGGLAPGVTINPASLPAGTVKQWYQADGALWKDTARTIPATADADPVAAWDDSSGNAFHVTQATPSACPTLKLAVRAGRNVVRFDGVDDNLFALAALGLGGSDAPFTLFTVCSFSALGGTYTIWSAGSTTSDTPLIRLYGSVNHWLFQKRDDASVSKTITGVTTTRLNEWYVAVLANTGTLGTIYENGIKSPPGLTNIDVGAITLNQTGIGTLRRSGASNQFKGDMGEVLLCAGLLSDATITGIVGFLKGRWGIP